MTEHSKTDILSKISTIPTTKTRFLIDNQNENVNFCNHSIAQIPTEKIRSTKVKNAYNIPNVYIQFDGRCTCLIFFKNFTPPHIDVTSTSALLFLQQKQNKVNFIGTTTSNLHLQHSHHRYKHLHTHQNPYHMDQHHLWKNHDVLYPRLMIRY